MDNELTVCTEQEVLGKTFRIYGTLDEPLFLAKDVAEWIEHSNATEMLRTIDDDEKLNSIILSAGQRRECSFLTEDGLYEVLMQSRKPIAREFKKRVKEILRSIRRHGVYATDETIEKVLADPDFGIKLLTELKSEREARLKAQQAQKALECQIENDRPKVVFADAVSTSNDAIHIGVLAKFLKQNGLDIGQNRLFERLRCEGFLIKNGHMKNMPTQRAMDAGLFAVQERVIMAGNGSQMLTTTTKVTPRGQQYFLQRFLGVQETLSWEKATATLE